MDVEIKIDQNYNKPKIIIYTNEITDEINNFINNVKAIDTKKIIAFKEEKMYILNSDNIESIFSQNGKVFARDINNELYIIKNRLYELETILDAKKFIRISNSEIVNIDRVKNFDFNFIGTILINFKSKNTSYVSRRYIPKIKKFLKI